jgi:predicted anti-sigma-YlaC factor YlaD
MTERFDRHLDMDETAAYVDGGATAAERARMEAHLATCADCRAELADGSRIVRSAGTARVRASRVWIPAAAAAVLALMWVAPRALRQQREPQHREAAVTMTVAPRPLLPVGLIDTARAFVWAAVPSANSYRVRVFNAEGTLMWECETADTLAALPDTIELVAQRSYYWRVEAQTGFDRWAASELTEFRLQRDRQR